MPERAVIWGPLYFLHRAHVEHKNKESLLAIARTQGYRSDISFRNHVLLRAKKRRLIPITRKEGYQ